MLYSPKSTNRLGTGSIQLNSDPNTAFYHVHPSKSPKCLSRKYPLNLLKKSYELYRVIRKSLRNFRPLRYSSQDGHAEGEHVNRGRDTPSFCPTLQQLDMSTFGDAADVNHAIKFLPHTLHVAGNIVSALYHKLQHTSLVLLKMGRIIARNMLS